MPSQAVTSPAGTYTGASPPGVCRKPCSLSCAWALLAVISILVFSRGIQRALVWYLPPSPGHLQLIQRGFRDPSHPSIESSVQHQYKKARAIISPADCSSLGKKTSCSHMLVAALQQCPFSGQDFPEGGKINTPDMGKMSAEGHFE